ncbi:hypothetical protein BDA99DRAFT_4619 [Phascolomyces articulosus]|uniref:SPIN90/Ldb17 leucine-rich domain-containing protein n=1 Tax=Phascolomyces articulosus TaxID=60185 RepID=A0AAD5KCC7_9FUNG|nr:hypothetical protein BDA99DRAFT_4619 [Phascolomyces articulosus]
MDLELDDIILLPCQNREDAERITTQYIRLVTRFQHDFCETLAERAQMAYKLIDSTLFLEHSTTILSHILHGHALVTTNENDSNLLIPYTILIYAGKEDPRWMKYIVSDARQNKQNRLFRKILQEITTDSYKLMGVSVVLAFEMCKVSRLRAADLDAITPNFLNHLLDVVETMVDDADESFSYDIIQLLLVFNEQFLMASKGEPSNKLLDVLENRIGTTNTFSANLIFMLNRSDDACVKLLILKLLYGIFTRPSLYEYFYTNDLYVLVDVMLREVCNLGNEREAAALRDAYLRVLRPLLINTQLRRAPYKQNEIHSTLCAMITPQSYVKIDPNTSRLVERILEEWWETICKQPMAPLLGVDVKGPLLATSLPGTNAQVVRSPSPYPMMRTSTSTSSNTSSTDSSPSSPTTTIQTPTDEHTPHNNNNNTSSSSNNNDKQPSADLVLCA